MMTASAHPHQQHTAALDGVATIFCACSYRRNRATVRVQRKRWRKEMTTNALQEN
jgi:hypothetical protein